MNDVPPPLLPTEAPENSPAAPKLRKTITNVIETIIALIASAAGFAGYEMGIFMNFVFVMLLLLAPIALLMLGWKLWQRSIAFTFLKNPFARSSRSQLLACLVRLFFFLSCGYLLSISIIPLQFPQETYRGLLITSWVLVAWQLVLAVMQTKRVSFPFIGFYLIGGGFICWQVAHALIPVHGETVSVRSPLRGICCVVQGGNSLILNHHYGLESQRYAVDFFKVADDLEQVRQWKVLEDTASLGETICSPCDGRIAFIEDSYPDNAKGEADAEHPAGNYLTIEVATNRFLMLAHLKAKSIVVKTGDAVRVGQPIAQCGNSGNTSGPHVHMQVQTSPQFSYNMSTIPMTFQNVVRKDEFLTNVQARRNDLLILHEQ